VLLDGGATLKGLAKNYNWRYHHEGYPCFPVIKYRTISEEPKSTPKTLSQSLQELTDNYVKAVRELTGSTTTSYNLFINCEGVKITENKRTSEDLKASGCSMRNLKGEFIK